MVRVKEKGIMEGLDTMHKSTVAYHVLCGCTSKGKPRLEHSGMVLLLEYICYK